MAEMPLERKLEQPHTHDNVTDVARTIDNQKFATWLYLASEVVIFTVLIAMYVLYRVSPEGAIAIKEVAGRTRTATLTLVIE